MQTLEGEPILTSNVEAFIRASKHQRIRIIEVFSFKFIYFTTPFLYTFNTDCQSDIVWCTHEDYWPKLNSVNYSMHKLFERAISFFIPLQKSIKLTNSIHSRSQWSVKTTLFATDVPGKHFEIHLRQSERM